MSVSSALFIRDGGPLLKARSGDKRASPKLAEMVGEAGGSDAGTGMLAAGAMSVDDLGCGKSLDISVANAGAVETPCGAVGGIATGRMSVCA
jgi:hypothetical protein